MKIFDPINKYDLFFRRQKMKNSKTTYNDRVSFIGVRVEKAIAAKMNECDEVHWPTVLRNAIKRKIEEVEMTKNLQM